MRAHQRDTSDVHKFRRLVASVEHCERSNIQSGLMRIQFPRLTDFEREVFSGISLQEAVFFCLGVITVVNLTNRIRRARMLKRKP